MKLSRRIPDLHYKVVRVPSIFTRGTYAVVFYRHDRLGRAYLDDIMTFPGNDLKEERSRACAHGRDIVNRRKPRGLLNRYVPVDARAAVRKAMPFLCDVES